MKGLPTAGVVAVIGPKLNATNQPASISVSPVDPLQASLFSNGERGEAESNHDPNGIRNLTGSSVILRDFGHKYVADCAL